VEDVPGESQAALNGPAIYWSATPRTVHYAITWRSDYNAAGTPATVENHSLTAIINSNHTVSLSGTNITSVTVPFDTRDLVTNDANSQSVQADATLLNLPGDGTATIEPPAPDSSPDAVLQTQTTNGISAPVGSAQAFTQAFAYRVPNNTAGVRQMMAQHLDQLAAVPQTFTPYGHCSASFDVASGALASKHCVLVYTPPVGSTGNLDTDPGRIVIDVVKQ
jgi:hypothetical protein